MFVSCPAIAADFVNFRLYKTKFQYEDSTV